MRNKSQGELCSARNGLAYVWFRIKGRPRNGIFGFGRTRNGTRAKKRKRGEERGRKETGFPSFLLHPLPALLLSRSLTLAPRSLLWKRTEMLATQARNGWKLHLVLTWYPDHSTSTYFCRCVCKALVKAAVPGVPWDLRKNTLSAVGLVRRGETLILQKYKHNVNRLNVKQHYKITYCIRQNELQFIT